MRLRCIARVDIECCNDEAVLMSTYNLCFEARKEKKSYTPAYPYLCYIKVGYTGVYITRTCYPDAKNKSRMCSKITFAIRLTLGLTFNKIK